MKSQEEELKELRKILKAWEVTERKWAKTLFHTKNNKRLWMVG
jgi:hypothetical protein